VIKSAFSSINNVTNYSLKTEQQYIKLMLRAGIALDCHAVDPGSNPGKDKASISEKSV